jgi:hypothetical protein
MNATNQSGGTAPRFRNFTKPVHNKSGTTGADVKRRKEVKTVKPDDFGASEPLIKYKQTGANTAGASPSKIVLSDLFDGGNGDDQDTSELSLGIRSLTTEDGAETGDAEGNESDDLSDADTVRENRNAGGREKKVLTSPYAQAQGTGESVTLLVDHKPVRLDELTSSKVKRYLLDLEDKRRQYPLMRREDTYSAAIRRVLEVVLGEDFESWDDKQFMGEMHRHYCKEVDRTDSLEGTLMGFIPRFSIKEQRCVSHFMHKVYTEIDNSGKTLSVKAEHAIVRKWCKYLEGSTSEPAAGQARINYHLWKEVKDAVHPTGTLKVFFRAVLDSFQTLYEWVHRVEYLCGATHSGSITENSGSKKRPRDSQESATNAPAKRFRAENKPGENSGAKQPCKGCGRNHAGGCVFASHPDFNRSDASWKTSETGRHYTALGQFFLPKDKRLSEDKESLVTLAKEIQVCQNVINTVTASNYPTIRIRSPANPNFSLEVLLDTGARSERTSEDNYIRREVVNTLGVQDMLSHASSCQHVRVCPVFGECTLNKECIVLSGQLYDTHNKNTINIRCQARVIDDLSAPIIIGLATMRAYHLTDIFHGYFGGDKKNPKTTPGIHVPAHNTVFDDTRMQVWL